MTTSREKERVRNDLEGFRLRQVRVLNVVDGFLSFLW